MDREKVISKLEKEVQQTYSSITAVFQNGKKVSEEISTHREPFVRITIEMADKILAMLKEQEAVKPRVSSAEQRCGNCNKVIEMDGWKVCPWCGKPILWEAVGRSVK